MKVGSSRLKYWTISMLVFGKSVCGSKPPEKMTYPLFSSATFYMSGAVWTFYTQIPVGLVVREGGHYPEVNLREGHLLEGAATSQNVYSTYHILLCIAFFPSRTPQNHIFCPLPWVDGHGDESDIRVGWFLGRTKGRGSGRLLAHLKQKKGKYILRFGQIHFEM